MRLADESHHTPLQPCPACSTLLDRACGMDLPERRGPRPGDATICTQCATFMIFNDDMSVRLMNQAEESELDANIWTAMNTLRQLLKKAHGGTH